MSNILLVSYCYHPLFITILKYILFASWQKIFAIICYNRNVLLCRKAGKYTAFLYLVQKIPAVEGISIAVIKIYTGQRQLYFKLKHLHDYTRKGFDEMSPFKVPKEISHAIMTENTPKSPCSTATTIKPPSRKCTDQLLLLGQVRQFL